MTLQVDHVEFSPEVKKWAKKWAQDGEFIERMASNGNPLTKAIAALMKEAATGEL